MTDTAFLRSDELPGRAALGYLEDEGLRTNVFHLPVRGNGDGGIYTTAADVHALWDSLFAGRIVSPELVADMVRPQVMSPADRRATGSASGSTSRPTQCRSTVSMPARGSSPYAIPRAVHATVLCNKGRGAWPAGLRIAAEVSGGRW